MKTKIKLGAVYAPSRDVVVRKVERDVIIIPFVSGVDDSENEPYFLNTTGQVIWQRLDGFRSLKEIVADLAAEFKAPVKIIEKDIIEFVEKLLMRKILIEVSGT
jgi:hypothetical protein